LLLVHHLIALLGALGADAFHDVDAGLEQSVCQMRIGREIAVFLVIFDEMAGGMESAKAQGLPTIGNNRAGETMNDE
jgi:hypothetical protein